MRAKAFLQQECRNVKSLLDSTLQHEYGVGGSQDFFDECSTRLELVEENLEALADTDNDELTDIGNRLIELAGLICRIERSALGTHSWPFVEELKKVALACCDDQGLMSVPPLIHVISEGGLDGYAMNPEKARPGYLYQRILTIVLPRSARHHVLLHSILGHEVGHAMYRCSEHQDSLNADVLELLKEGLFADENAVRDYIYSSSAPPEVQSFTKGLEARGLDAKSLFWWASFEAWIEEVLCDLVGLVTFGPSFVAATCELLSGLSPACAEFDEGHPPVGWRINAVLRCAELLHMDTLPAPEHPTHDKFKLFWDNVKARRRANPWYNVFTDAQLNGAITNIQAILGPLEPASYKKPSPDLLLKLLGHLEGSVPPTGFALNADGAPECEYVDFRHITFAGWIECQSRSEEAFENINMLCEHGIMQQAAINITLKKADEAEKGTA